MMKHVLNHAFSVERESLQETLKLQDPDIFRKAVDLLQNAPRIAATGCGHSGICAQHFAHLMCCIEKPARFLSPAEAVHGAMGFLQPGDVLLWFSRGGQTDELTKILEICKTKAVSIIGITEKTTSPLACQSDVVLPVRITAECDKYNSQGTTSFVVMSAVCDALQAAVIEATDYQNEQFALIHPGGAVGKRLNQI